MSSVCEVVRSSDEFNGSINGNGLMGSCKGLLICNILIVIMHNHISLLNLQPCV